MRVAVVGATGLVGREMLAVLQEFNFPVSELIPIASERSQGRDVPFQGKGWRVVSLSEGLANAPDVTFFSAGAVVSKAWAQQFVQAGSLVIDNSSAWRLEPDVPLVVAEVNLATVGSARLIANPNCSTMQLSVVLAPLQAHYGIQRVVISTYQGITGSGKAAEEQLAAERRGDKHTQMVYPHPIDLNCIPHCDVFLENDYTREEMKLVNESRKILGLPHLRLTATCVRVPVLGGHSEAVNVQLEQPASAAQLRALLAASPGIVVQDDPQANLYPMPRNIRHRNEVFVGRIRKDESLPDSFNLWIVADNLRKGAATNAVQVAQALLLRSATVV